MIGEAEAGSAPLEVAGPGAVAAQRGHQRRTVVGAQYGRPLPACRRTIVFHWSCATTTTWAMKRSPRGWVKDHVAVLLLRAGREAARSAEGWKRVTAADRFSELTYATLVDGESAAEEVPRKVRNHLAACSVCQDLVELARREPCPRLAASFRKKRVSGQASLVPPVLGVGRPGQWPRCWP